jgi:hypothetical protein
MQTPFPHHLFQVAVAERVSQVPTHAQQNDFGFKVAPFERALLVHENNSSRGLDEKQSLPHHRYFCNTTVLHQLHRVLL